MFCSCTTYVMILPVWRFSCLCNKTTSFHSVQHTPYPKICKSNTSHSQFTQSQCMFMVQLYPFLTWAIVYLLCAFLFSFSQSCFLVRVPSWRIDSALVDGNSTNTSQISVQHLLHFISKSKWKKVPQKIINHTTFQRVSW